MRLRKRGLSPIFSAVETHPEKWLLKLYVFGKGLLSARARENLERLCRENPALAREHEIVAVPTVVREAPVPIRKMCGDFSDIERALRTLQFARRP
jgi:circadian clock protein KaiB